MYTKQNKKVNDDLFTIKKYYLVNKLYINDQLAKAEDLHRLTKELNSGTQYSMMINTDTRTLNVLID